MSTSLILVRYYSDIVQPDRQAIHIGLAFWAIVSVITVNFPMLMANISSGGTPFGPVWFLIGPLVVWGLIVSLTQEKLNDLVCWLAITIPAAIPFFSKVYEVIFH